MLALYTDWPGGERAPVDVGVTLTCDWLRAESETIARARELGVVYVLRKLCPVGDVVRFNGWICDLFTASCILLSHIAAAQLHGTRLSQSRRYIIEIEAYNHSYCAEVQVHIDRDATVFHHTIYPLFPPLRTEHTTYANESTTEA